MSARRSGDISIEGDMYTAEIDGCTEIGDLASAVAKRRTEVLEAFRASGVSAARIARLARKKPTRSRRSEPAENPDPRLTAAAARGDRRGLVRALSAGASPNAQDSAGYTALMLASHRGHLILVNALIEAGARIDLVNPRHRNRGAIRGGGTALSLAIERNHLIVARRLAPLVDLRSRSKSVTTVLFAAAAAPNRRYLELLLALGINVTRVGPSRRTALHVAAGRGTPASIRLLVSKGLDVNARAADRSSPLHWAAENGRTGAVRALLQLDASSTKDSSGQTPLALAKAVGAPAALIALLTASGNDRPLRR